MNAVAACAREPASVYSGRSAALLTRHGKEALLEPLLREALDCRLVHVDGYDTDLLGTFTREMPRAGSQLDAARRKARVGMELAGTRIGLASEGSFGGDPLMGLIPWNHEVVVWIDDERGLEVVGRAHAAACSGSCRVATWDEAERFATQHRFPQHALVARPSHSGHPRILKGIRTDAELRAAFERARAEADDGLVFLEVDVRAHRNPTRQAVIRQAGLDLMSRLRSLCPSCGAPGYGVARQLPGLPCADCGTTTHETRSAVHACVACGHEQECPVAAASADPGHCPCCNP